MIGHGPRLQKAASTKPAKVSAVLLPVILPVIGDFDVSHARRITTDMAMTDGFTTQPGLGSGLPGTRRLMDEFTIFSALGRATRVTARLWR